MEPKDNVTLLYEIIGKLSDDEFKELLSTLGIMDKAEEVVEEETKEEVVEEEGCTNDARVAAIQEKLVAARKKKEIQEKLTAIRKKKAIQEKLELARKKKAVQEKLENFRKTAENKQPAVDEKAALRAKVQEKLENARKKKEIQERVKSLRNK